MLNVALGTYYAWSVFVPALENEFHWTRTQTSLVATIDMVMLASSFLLAGVLQSRIGPRAVATIGGLLYSAGLFLASYTQSLTMLYLTWGVMVGIGLGFGYLAPITVGSKWFPNHRGLVNGLAIGIFAAGSGIFGPDCQDARRQRRLANDVADLRRDVLRLHHGRRVPDEGSAARVHGAGERFDGASTGRRRTTSRYPTSQVLRTPMFYALWLAYALGTTAGTMVISQLVPFARASGFNAARTPRSRSPSARSAARPADSCRAGCPITSAGCSRCAASSCCRWWRRRRCISGAKKSLLFYVLLFIVYYCYGTQLSVYTALAGDFYGTKYLATNYGVLLLAWGFAGVLGPVIGSRVFVSTGTYQYAFFGSAVLACAALGLLSIVRPPSPVGSAQSQSTV